MTQGDETRKLLLLTLKKLERENAQAEQGGGKAKRISISGVAKLAGVSHTLIHTKYPDVLERIRASMGKSLIEQRQRKHDSLKKARGQIADLKESQRASQIQSKGLASENARLTLLVTTLEARIKALEAGAKPFPRRP